jgi:hypothetical protein
MFTRSSLPGLFTLVGLSLSCGGANARLTSQAPDAGNISLVPDPANPDAGPLWNPGNGQTEICDGIDNNENGAIDDLDVARDGVCDCLRVATLGYRGSVGTANVFTQWLNGKSTYGAVALESQVITDDLLRPFHIVVVQDSQYVADGVTGPGYGVGRVFSNDEVAALQRWVNAGGGLMTLIGYGAPSEVTNVNRLLAPYGMSYGSIPILYKGGSTIPITTWVSHPISDKITAVGVDNGFEAQGGALVASGPAPEQYSVGRINTPGAGRVFVWADEWITFDSEWTGHPDYQLERFWQNLLLWLSPPDQCQIQIPVIN